MEAGDPDSALRELHERLGGYTDAEIDACRARRPGRPASPPRPTVPRELRAERAFRIDALRLGELGAPALVLVGSESPDWAHRSTAAYAEAIPGASCTRSTGQGHGAAVSGPELLADELGAFFG